MNRGLAHWGLQIPGCLLLAYLFYAQAIPAFDYELGVRMGTQEPAGNITEVGAAFWYGFALADLAIYIPLLGAGLLGHWLGRQWWKVFFSAALGITLYWPLVVLTAAVNARDAAGWDIDETAYWAVLPLIAGWALCALFVVVRTTNKDPKIVSEP
jgi:hypothetical protein